MIEPEHSPILRKSMALNIERQTGVKTPENVVKLRTLLFSFPLFKLESRCSKLGPLNDLNNLKHNINNQIPVTN